MGGGFSREQVDGISLQHAVYPFGSDPGRRSRGDDHYESVEQVIEALQRNGLESCNLIVGVDFTRSNEWKGKNSFGGQCLHDISGTPNPYEQAIGIIGKTLLSFDEDGEIPFFGFGDASTHDHDVFSYYPDHRRCNGVSEGLAQYREIVPHLQLSGPTSFAPIIEMAIDIVKQSGYYHILLIIADGQVSGGNDSGSDRLSFQEQRTIEAIVNASWFPLSIILVGVGDGPWNQMEQYVNGLPARCFDNFQFVNFTDIMSRDMPESRKEAQFALEALRKIPSQYEATTKLQIDDQDVTTTRAPLPPPLGNVTGTLWPPRRPGYQDLLGYNLQGLAQLNASTQDEICSVCSLYLREMVFGCGHGTCCVCGETLNICPICQQSIQLKAMF